jgi:Tfp pilus assembly protein PilE
MARRKPRDQVEAILARADETLEEWFAQSRVTTGQAAIVFARFLTRAAKGLEGVSERLSASSARRRTTTRRRAAATPAGTSRRAATTAASRRRPRRTTGPRRKAA